jgi:uncharacterized membrane-anchored protein
MYVRGVAKVDARTKNLVKRLTSGDIAVINHSDLDGLAARALLETRPRAVINASKSFTGSYPTAGPLLLIQGGVPLLDGAGEDFFHQVQEGQVLEIRGEKIYSGGKFLGAGQILEESALKEKMEKAGANLNSLLAGFIENTFAYARREIGLVTGEYAFPPLRTTVKNRHVLVVVRGDHYKEDLRAIRSYIKDMRPVLIGVDGGADALLEEGYRPDLVVGDMDSVSCKALCCGAELVVHAYPDGRSPGGERVARLGLPAVTLAAPGTSEDIAVLLAYEKGAELIVVVGGHFCFQDFLEKGRQGMGSTFLVRLKAGSILVDARGVSRLYSHRLKASHVVQFFLAALLPAGIVISVSPAIREFFRLALLQLKLSFFLFW